jgi:hypothetical protein
MTTHPSTAELTRAVAKWIDDIRPHLSQRDAYLARVAVNALAIIEREVAQGEKAYLAMGPVLAKLLREEGDYDSLMRRHCEELRSGEVNAATPGVLSALRQDTLAKLAIDQPSYRHEESE